MQCIHHKLKSQISYDNVLLLSIVIHRKVFPSWMHLSFILGPRFVRTKFSPQKNRIGRHPPLGYFIAQHLPPLQSWSRPATCWPEKYPPSGGKPHAHLCAKVAETLHFEKWGGCFLLLDTSFSRFWDNILCSTDSEWSCSKRRTMIVCHCIVVMDPNTAGMKAQ